MNSAAASSASVLAGLLLSVSAVVVRWKDVAIVVRLRQDIVVMQWRLVHRPLFLQVPLRLLSDF